MFWGGPTDNEINAWLAEVVFTKTPGHLINQEEFVQLGRTMSAIGGWPFRFRLPKREIFVATNTSSGLGLSDYSNMTRERCDMKTKHWVAAVVGMVIALALLAGNARAADDDTSYRYRLVNDVNTATYIRCGSSGDWTTVAINDSTDVSCSQSTAQTKMEGGAEISHTHGCPSSQPVLRARYSGYYSFGGKYKSTLHVGCRAS